MLENSYQASVIKKVKLILPQSFVIKLDTGLVQGMLDLLVLNWDRWGMLEVKTSFSAPMQPNQQYYVEKFGEMSFAAVIYPENEDEVLNDLQHALEPRRNSRVPKSQQPKLVELRRGKTR